ncbi:MAG: permease-like cell division protein FtsX [Candidatus Edwardsbacteria bacterium]
MALNISYSFKEALLSFKRARLMTLVSIFIITISLFILGIFLIATVNLHRLIKQAQEKVEITVFLKDELSSNSVQTLKGKIREMGGVKEVHYISKEEALKRFRQELSEKGDLLDALETNPLPPSFQVKVLRDCKDPKYLAYLSSQIASLSGVEEVEYGKDWVEKLYQVIVVLLSVDGLLLIIFVFASLFVVSNTIRLTIFARREAIEIMKLVGATDNFIRRPFLLEGIIQGVIGAGMSLGSLYLGYHFLSEKWGGVVFLGQREILFLVGFGVLVGILGSYISLKRFLRL